MGLAAPTATNHTRLRAPLVCCSTTFYGQTAGKQRPNSARSTFIAFLDAFYLLSHNDLHSCHTDSPTCHHDHLHKRSAIETDPGRHAIVLM